MSASDAETAVLGWLAEREPDMIALLRDVVNMDSGSYDKAGVDAVGARFEQFFAEHCIRTERERHDTFGDAIHVLPQDTPRQREADCPDGAIAIRCSLKEKSRGGHSRLRMAVPMGPASPI